MPKKPLEEDESSPSAGASSSEPLLMREEVGDREVSLEYLPPETPRRFLSRLYSWPLRAGRSIPPAAAAASCCSCLEGGSRP